jgi:HEAT repeat protein
LNSSKPALDLESACGRDSVGVPVAPTQPRSSRPSLIIVLVPVLVVLVTFLFWYSTWFGRPLGDREMAECLTDTSVPHRTQHALAQVAEEIARHDLAARRWYPQVLALGRNREPQFRLMAAWVMGQDNASAEFHEELRSMVADPEPVVRWNAALALVRFGDSTGEPQLKLLLRAYTVAAPLAGRVRFRLKPGDPVESGGAIAQLKNGSAPPVDVRSPLTGHLEQQIGKDGATVEEGAPIALLSPGEQQVWEALRALYLAGRPDDLADVERYAGGVAGMPERVRQQATITAQAIRQRAVTSDK